MKSIGALVLCYVIATALTSSVSATHSSLRRRQGGPSSNPSGFSKNAPSAPGTTSGSKLGPPSSASQYPPPTNSTSGQSNSTKPSTDNSKAKKKGIHGTKSNNTTTAAPANPSSTSSAMTYDSSVITMVTLAVAALGIDRF